MFLAGRVRRHNLMRKLSTHRFRLMSRPKFVKGEEICRKILLLLIIGMHLSELLLLLLLFCGGISSGSRWCCSSDAEVISKWRASVRAKDNIIMDFAIKLHTHLYDRTIEHLCISFDCRCIINMLLVYCVHRVFFRGKKWWSKWYFWKVGRYCY